MPNYNCLECGALAIFGQLLSFTSSDKSGETVVYLVTACEEHKVIVRDKIVRSFRASGKYQLMAGMLLQVLPDRIIIWADRKTKGWDSTRRIWQNARRPGKYAKAFGFPKLAFRYDWRGWGQSRTGKPSPKYQLPRLRHVLESESILENFVREWVHELPTDWRMKPINSYPPMIERSHEAP